MCLWKSIKSIIGILCVLISIGCAGPKFFSNNSGSQQDWDILPLHEDVTLRMLESVCIPMQIDDKNMEQVFAEILAERIRESHLYRNVIVCPSQGNFLTRFIIEVKLIDVRKTEWRARSFGAYSFVGAAGRVVDSKGDKVLLTFEKNRSGQGGIIGYGGLLTAGSDAMIRKIVEWLADDIVETLENNQKNRNLMKNKIFFLLLISIIFFYGCAKTVSTSTLENTVSYNKFKDQKLPIKAAIYLPEDFIKKMPDSFGNNPEIWPWLFKRGIEPVFEKSIVIKNFDEIRAIPDVTVVIKPELWGFYWQAGPPGFGSGQNCQCWLDFRFKLLDKNGNVLSTVTAEGKGIYLDTTNALVQCVNEVIEKFQKSIISSEREKILSSSER